MLYVFSQMQTDFSDIHDLEKKCMEQFASFLEPCTPWSKFWTVCLISWVETNEWNPNEWNKWTAAAGATDRHKGNKGCQNEMMAACLSWRANAGFFISLSWFGLPGAAELHDLLLQDNPAGQPMPMCVSQLLCLSCRDRWMPPRQAIRPQITPMFTAAEHHQHSATLLWIYFFPRLMPCPLFPLSLLLLWWN